MRHITIKSGGRTIHLRHGTAAEVGAAIGIPGRLWWIHECDGDERVDYACGCKTKREALDHTERVTGLDLSVAR